MAKKSNLPIEAHDHFRKANALHTCVQVHVGEAVKHALETGQELMLAKGAVPHGRWEVECDRLFDGSLRTAQFYMQFAKNCSKLKSAQKTAILFLESTLDGAAKAAKKATQPDPAPRPPQEPELIVEPEPEPFPIKAVEPCGLIVEPPTNGNGKPPKQYEPEVWLRRWDQAIRGPVKFVDTLQEGLGQRNSQHSRAVLVHLSHATDAMMEWLDVD